MKLSRMLSEGGKEEGYTSSMRSATILGVYSQNVSLDLLEQHKESRLQLALGQNYRTMSPSYCRAICEAGLLNEQFTDHEEQ